MALLLSILVDDILPVFLVAGAGWLLARYLGAEAKTLSRVMLYGMVPCLAFTTLITSPISAADFGRIALFTVSAIAGIGLLAWLVLMPLRLERATLCGLLIAVMFSNAGNYGLPLVSFAFGQQALAWATIYFVLNLILMYTLGVLVAASGQRARGVGQALLGMAKMPVVYAMVAAVVVKLTGVTLPPAIMRPAELLGAAALPVMVLVLGMQLQGTGAGQPLLLGLATALRLVAAPLVALGLAIALGLRGPALQAGLVQTAMPSAVIAAILAIEYEAAPALVTNVVFVSTLLSPLTLTVIVALLQR